MNQQLTIIGVMSGTSLDGIDVCAAEFDIKNGVYSFKILKTNTYSYPEHWRSLLKEAYHKENDEVKELSKSYGIYVGEIIVQFVMENKLEGKIDLIGSHGHTVFHQPENGFTLQIGDGSEIAKKTKINTISDFRSKDVSLGGQGAPLVPIGDRLLFSAYDSCLNLGGIANISFEQSGERIAFDICPCNLPLNKIVNASYDLEYDQDGKLASSGKVNQQLLDELNKLSFYQKKHPKSLGQEWMDEQFYPLTNKFDLNVVDELRTILEHETDQIAEVLEKYDLDQCLVTGGGALNNFFIKQLKKKTSTEIVLPKIEIIEFKEALVFAFLAYLNAHNKVNTLASVTGAKRDSIGGVFHDYGSK